MRVTIGICFLSFFFGSLPAMAQIVGVVPGTNYLAVNSPSGGGGVCANGNCVDPTLGIPLNTYATNSSVANQFSATNGQLAGLNSTLASVNGQLATANSQIAGLNSSLATANGQLTTANSQIAGLNSSLATANGHIIDLNNGLRRQTSFAAAVGAMRDAIPNDGDRFAVRGSFATVGNAVGGGFSASANLDRQFRATINYGGSRGERVVSGGLNFSFN